MVVLTHKREGTSCARVLKKSLFVLHFCFLFFRPSLSRAESCRCLLHEHPSSLLLPTPFSAGRNWGRSPPVHKGKGRKNINAKPRIYREINSYERIHRTEGRALLIERGKGRRKKGVTLIVGACKQSDHSKDTQKRGGKGGDAKEKEKAKRTGGHARVIGIHTRGENAMRGEEKR